jgi:hypothetical protein
MLFALLKMMLESPQPIFLAHSASPSVEDFNSLVGSHEPETEFTPDDCT